MCVRRARRAPTRGVAGSARARQASVIARVLPPTFAVVFAAGIAQALPVRFAERYAGRDIAGAVEIDQADLDADGDIDLVVAALIDGVVVLWSDGRNPPTFAAQVVTSNLSRPSVARAADVDADGLPDIIAGDVAGEIGWIRNLGGGTFGDEVQRIAQTGATISALRPTDLDGDGDVDIVAAALSPAGVVWYQNLGGDPPTFQAHQVDATLVSMARAVDCADLNGDGWKDIVAADGVHSGGAVYWYPSLGPPAFGFGAGRVTAGSLVSPSDVVAADLDGNGSMDLAVASDGEILALLNSGTGSPTFARVTVDASASSARTIEAADIDRDGDADLVSGLPGAGEARWYDNDGSGLHFSGHTLPLSVGSGITFQDVVVVDLDADDDADVLVVRADDGDITFLEHVAPVRNTVSGVLFPTLGEAVGGALAGDQLLADPGAFLLDVALDLRSTADVAISSRGDVAQPPDARWWLGDRSTIAGARWFPGDRSVCRLGGVLECEGSNAVLDVDLFTVAPGGRVVLRDGSSVMTSALETTLEGKLELGASASWVSAGSAAARGAAGFQERVAATGLGSPEDVALADFDSDGDLDMVCTDRGADLVRWFENIDGTTFIEALQVSDPGIDAPRGVAATDLDGDGDLDVTAAIDGTNRFVWFENISTTVLSFDAPRVVSLDSVDAWGVRAADLDGDGDMDLVGTENTADAVVWFENDGEVPPAFESRVIDDAIETARALDVGDLDGDGDLDVVAGGATDGMVVWYTNDGPGTGAWARHVLLADLGKVVSVSIADADDDGDLDIFVATEDDGIGWVRNLGGTTPTFGAWVLITTTATMPTAITAGDIDGDGAVDTVLASQGDDAIRLFTNDGGDPPTFAEAVLSRDVDFARNIAVADVNADGEPDIVGVAPNAGQVTLLLAARAELHVAENADFLALGALRLGSPHVTLAGGRLLSDDEITIERSGLLAGAGTVEAPRTASSGAINPADASVIHIVGDYAQRSGEGGQVGTLRVRINTDGVAARLDVSGSAELAGTLIVTADPAFDPPEHARFTVLTAGTPIGDGRFGAALLPGLPGGKYLRVAYDTDTGVPGSVQLVVEQLPGGGLVEDPTDPTAVDAAGIPSGAALGHLNADAFNDLALIIPDEVNPTGSAGALLVLFNAGTAADGSWQGFANAGAMQFPTGPDPVAVAIGPLDADAGDDIAVANRADGTVSIFLADGLGAVVPFGAPMPFVAAPADILLGDVDGDHRLDVLCVGASDTGGELATALNLGGGWDGLSTVRRTSVLPNVTSADSGDLDNDGCLDMVAAASRSDDAVSVVLNLEGGQGDAWLGFGFRADYPVGSRPDAVALADLDADTVLDLITADRGSGTVSVALGVPAGSGASPTFAPALPLPVANKPRSLVPADIDADGDVDLAVIAADEGTDPDAVFVLRNSTPAGDDDGPGALIFAPAQVVATGGEPVLLLASDVDADAAPDLVVVNRLPPEGRGHRRTGRQAEVFALLGVSVCPGDLDGDADVDDADTLAFVTSFLAGSGLADLDHNGVLNLDDVNHFVTAFLLGCP